MATSKFSKALQQYLEKTQQLESTLPVAIEVVVELKSSPVNRSGTFSKQEKIKMIKRSFTEDLDSINHVMQDKGVKIIDTAWINKTIKMKVPLASLDELSNINSVENIDLPQQLKKDE